MFGPFESVVLGILGLSLALVAIQWGVWALRFGARASTAESGGE